MNKVKFPRIEGLDDPISFGSRTLDVLRWEYLQEANFMYFTGMAVKLNNYRGRMDLHEEILCLLPL